MAQAGPQRPVTEYQVRQDPQGDGVWCFALIRLSFDLTFWRHFVSNFHFDRNLTCNDRRAEEKVRSELDGRREKLAEEMRTREQKFIEKRKENEKEQDQKRSQTMKKIEQKDKKVEKLLSEREQSIIRARKMAETSALLREIIKSFQ